MQRELRIGDNSRNYASQQLSRSWFHRSRNLLQFIASLLSTLWSQKCATETCKLSNFSLKGKNHLYCRSSSIEITKDRRQISKRGEEKSKFASQSAILPGVRFRATERETGQRKKKTKGKKEREWQWYGREAVNWTRAISKGEGAVVGSLERRLVGIDVAVIETPTNSDVVRGGGGGRLIPSRLPRGNARRSSFRPREYDA